MTADDIKDIVRKGLFPGTKTGASLVETHISWVILTDEFAFKIKKPVSFDFLDFGTIALRKHFCEEELRLNARLASAMYIGVLPVGSGGIGSTDLPIRDYALQMHRMDNAREMDKLLLTHDVQTSDMEHLAELLSEFHLNNRLVLKNPYQPTVDAQDFAGLFALEADLISLGVSDAGLLQTWKTSIPAFLHTHAARSEARMHAGFWIEGHGDLHTRNIFLPQNGLPIVFDCLEFNPHFRRMDVLNELAFLSMDLAFFGREDLAQSFILAYKNHWPCWALPEDDQLFNYFKAYRANVRLKVTLLELRQHQSEQLIHSALTFWKLLKRFLADLNAG